MDLLYAWFANNNKLKLLIIQANSFKIFTRTYPDKKTKLIFDPEIEQGIEDNG